MTSRSASLALVVFVFALVLSSASAQDPLSLRNGTGVSFFADSMYGPTEMSFDNQGNLYIGSGYEPAYPKAGHPTYAGPRRTHPVARPGGTLTSFR